MIICRQFAFDSAHKLDDYAGKCGGLHGHTYKIQVCLAGEVNKNGLIFDLQDLKDIVNEKVIKVLDHKYLNDIIENASVENVTLWIWNELKPLVPLHEITLWETPGIFTVYNGK